MRPTWASECGRAVLYCGDALEVLPRLEAGSVDALVTDPPYGISHNSHGQWFVEAKPIVGDDSLSLADTVRMWCREAGRAWIPCVMFFSPYMPLSGWRNVLCWRKGAQVGIGGDRETCWKRDFELIGVEGNRPLNGKRDSAVLDYPSDVKKKSGHFAEKPLPLLVYLIRKVTAVGQVVLDPFLGSGTTGVAAIRTGRRFVGCEIDECYFAIARRRIEAELAKERQSLFAGLPDATPQPTLLDAMGDGDRP